MEHYQYLDDVEQQLRDELELVRRNKRIEELRVRLEIERQILTDLERLNSRERDGKHPAILAFEVWFPLVVMLVGVVWAALVMFS